MGTCTDTVRLSGTGGGGRGLDNLTATSAASSKTAIPELRTAEIGPT